jgi:hypothetical protein
MRFYSRLPGTCGLKESSRVFDVISLKLFLDGLAGENHPFRKGPDLKQGPAAIPEVNKVQDEMFGDDVDVPETSRTQFYFQRINKN